MRFFRLMVAFFCGVFLVSESGYAQEKLWVGFQKDSIVSSLDGAIQRFYYYGATGTKKNPLVVFLHQWSSDYTSFKNSLAPQAKEKNWNYIHPDFRGANKHIKACGSQYVIEDIDEAIDWAVKNLSVDTANIYVVGASGGGYAALWSFLKSRHHVKEFSVWVPVSDLKRWYYESKSRNSKYAEDIVRCTCGNCTEINLEEAVKRSPLYGEVPADKLKTCKLGIYAGIHDGHSGAVPIAHSIDFFNKVVASLGGGKRDQVSPEDKNQMLTTQVAPGKIRGKIGDRDVLYFKKYKNVSLTIFEGGHEILVDNVLPGN